MSFQLPYLSIFTLTALLVLVLPGAESTNLAFSQNNESQLLTIELQKDSSPRFYECNVSPVNGSLFINGLNSEESAEKVLTDGNPNTGIMGDARFIVHFGQPLFNEPGPELSVIELSGAEAFNASIGNPNLGANSITLLPQAVNGNNSCNYSINEALIDLNDLDVPEGSSVPYINIDNLGEKDSLLGADLGDISIINSRTNDNRSSSLYEDFSFN